MAEFDNTNRGQVWKNDKRETESHPHFKGSVDVEGAEYWVSMWKRAEDANPNAPLLKFSLTKKEYNSSDKTTKTTKAPVVNDEDFDW